MVAPKILIRLLGLIIPLTLLAACEFSSLKVDENVTPVYISDINGDRYEITFAILEYGFEKKHFSHGSGPDTRPPLIEPDMLMPGDLGYPDKLATARVIGASVASQSGGESRAYTIAQISRYEVVDDIVAGAHITVAY